jgi:hypothetical protein
MNTDETHCEPREELSAARERKEHKDRKMFNRCLTLMNGDSQGCKPEG